MDTGVHDSWHEALEAVYKAAPELTAKSLVGVIAESISQVYKKLEGKQSLTLEDLARLSKKTDVEPIAQWVCGLADRVAVPKPKAVPCPALRVAAVMREAGEVIEEATRALEDGEVSAIEAKRIRATVLALHESAEALALSAEASVVPEAVGPQRAKSLAEAHHG